MDYESAYMRMREDFEREPSQTAFRFAPLGPGGLAEHVAHLEAQERGEGLPEGHVPQTTFWLVRNSESVIGEARLRHKLTPALEQVGGHIGYAIRPSERHMGYATKMLRLVLKEAKKLGLKRVLLTCDPENTASARVMLKNGAFQGTDSTDPETGKPHSRYWIRL